MKNNKDVEWGVLTSSAEFNNFKDSLKDIREPMYVVKSPVDEKLRTAFYLADGTWLRTIDGSAGLWGYGGTPLGGNPFKEPLPEVLQLTVFDNFHDQFYQLIQPLPMEKINDLFRQAHRGLADEEEYPRPNVYRSFDIGFAPHGWIILYAVGPTANRVEIGAWQAKKIDADYNQTVGLTMTGNLEYLKTHDLRPKHIKSALEDFKDRNPKLYQRWAEGSWRFSSDWYKQMQTKFPWNLEVSTDFGEWSGEYYAVYANTERYEVLDDQLEADHQRLKAVPTKIWTWIDDKKTGERYSIEVHLLPIPKWDAERYIPYYNDPNMLYLFKRFQHLYPKNSLLTNQQPVAAADFAKLKIHFDADLRLKAVNLEKAQQELPIEGAYQYYMAPVDRSRGRYYPQGGYDYFLTEPKNPDLTDPEFADKDE